MSHSTAACFFLSMLCVLPSVAESAEPPRALDPDWKIELVSQEPDLVTPTGCCFDDAGRLLVVECHTHFPPEEYEGPKSDRIYLFDDSNGDGSLDRKRLFHEGGRATMHVANLGEGWIAVTTRSELIRIRDSDGDDVADQREVLLTHRTDGTYPHNGLGGLTLGPNGWLYLGQGENLGESYELIGTDGAKQIGGGEGGNVFRCRSDGSQLERVATGFWNPFGLCFDSAERLWAVGNDPDSMPPCRLLHVVPGGDYGFQFRFGRAGIHPLQCWNGELPGTLPMAAGTGEATCAVAAIENHLWVTSWGDNRIERYEMEPHGASWAGQTEVVVQGAADFRPVGLAVASDGSIYVTDWVDRSYPVHGKGRLWRISRKLESADDSPVQNDKPGQPNQHSQPNQLSQPTEIEQIAQQLRRDPRVTVARRLESLLSDDPFVAQAAMFGLVHTKQIDQLSQADSPRQQAWLLSARRWQEIVSQASVSADARKGWITDALASESDEVLIAAIRWASERGCTDQLPAIRKLLDRDGLSVQLFSVIVGSIAYLESGSAASGKHDPVIANLLLEVASDPERSAKLRAVALQRIHAAAEAPSDSQLGDWIDGQHDRAFVLEVIRLLASRGTDAASDVLKKVSLDESYDLQTRADALAGLAKSAGVYSRTLNQLSLPKQPEVLRQEARRMLNRTWNRGKQPRPRREDVQGWMKLVGSGGDPQAGRRVFSRSTCVNCHAHSGRGATTGPDLTTLSGRMSPLRVLESILLPSKEVGPLYVPWQILTVDGKVLTGLKLDKSGVGHRLPFQGADGNTFEIQLEDIEMQTPIEQSIMPTGLEDAMTLDELRDLVAFLAGSR